MINTDWLIHWRKRIPHLHQILKYQIQKYSTVDWIHWATQSCRFQILSLGSKKKVILWKYGCKIGNPKFTYYLFQVIFNPNSGGLLVEWGGGVGLKVPNLLDILNHQKDGSRHLTSIIWRSLPSVISFCTK